MVSLQDDTWFDKFREKDVPDDSCGVWDDWTGGAPNLGPSSATSCSARSPSARVARREGWGLRLWRSHPHTKVEGLVRGWWKRVYFGPVYSATRTWSF